MYNKRIEKLVEKIGEAIVIIKSNSDRITTDEIRILTLEDFQDIYDITISEMKRLGKDGKNIELVNALHILNIGSEEVINNIHDNPIYSQFNLATFSDGCITNQLSLLNLSEKEIIESSENYVFDLYKTIYNIKDKEVIYKIIKNGSEPSVKLGFFEDFGRSKFNSIFIPSALLYFISPDITLIPVLLIIILISAYRNRDIGNPSSYMIFMLIPFINILMLIILMTKESIPREQNKQLNAYNPLKTAILIIGLLVFIAIIATLIMISPEFQG